MERNERFAVIFDMDGVIFDSERAYIEAFRKLTEENGISFIERACIDSIGSNRERTREIFCDCYGADFDFTKYYEDVREILRQSSFDLKPGARDLLAFLKEHRIPIALASSTTRNSVMRMLDEADLLRYFDVVICGDMVSRSKPHPEIFWKAASEIGIAPDHCYVIEDSFNGIRAACSAGMTAVMVPDILPPDDEMREKADYIFPSLQEAQEFFSQRI